jgi:hypothetical protein
MSPRQRCATQAPASVWAQSALLAHAIARSHEPLGPQRLPMVAGGLVKTA